MKKYIGVKLIEAEPMTRGEFADFQQRPTCADDFNEDGYRVKYSDNYVSWSPKDVFEEAYKPIGNLSFGMAFDMLKKGMFTEMRLPQWKEDVAIKIQYPDENSKMTAPYLYVESRFGKVPWKETMIELFSDKWEVR